MVSRTVFVFARSREAFDEWEASFVHSDGTRYVYVAGISTLEGQDARWENLHRLDHWALNPDYSVQLVNHVTHCWEF